MKKNEIIELNGVEYTLELNRESFLAIDKICNVSKTYSTIFKQLYSYDDEKELADDYNPFENLPTEEEMDKFVEEKENAMNKLVERAFYVWLYPNHKLSMSEVQSIVSKYYETEEGSEFIGKLTGKLLNDCIEIRDAYNQDKKNLIAQANK